MAETDSSHPNEFQALQDKVVLVTGGASGLGRDVSTRAAARGAKLVLLDIRADRLSGMKSLLDARNSPCLTFEADVSNEGDVTAAMSETVARWGRLDVAVNTAGVYRG